MLLKMCNAQDSPHSEELPSPRCGSGQHWDARPEAAPHLHGRRLAGSHGVRITSQLVCMGIWDAVSALPLQESGACLQCLRWKNTFLC